MLMWLTALQGVMLEAWVCFTYRFEVYSDIQGKSWSKIHILLFYKIVRIEYRFNLLRFTQIPDINKTLHQENNM